MFREEVIAIVLSTAIVGCGGSVAGKTGVSDQGDGSVRGGGGISGSPIDRRAGGSISSGGTAGSSGLVACNDGSGKMDCCPSGATIDGPCDTNVGRCSSPCGPAGLQSLLTCGPNGRWQGGFGLVPCGGHVACNDGTGSTDCCPTSATNGASCDGTVSQCSRGCHDGFKGYLYCGTDGTWTAGQGLFPCGVDAGVPSGNVDAGPSNPVFCQFAGGQCLIGGSSCSKVIESVDCNPAQTGPGSFCCLDAPPECTDANVQMIQASNYDQSCKTNSDCIGVGEGNACYTCLISCANAAINVQAKSQYDADVAKTLAGRLAGSPFCGCPAGFGPCCIGGLCRADIQCSMSGP